jgi:hypothetical protein
MLDKNRQQKRDAFFLHVITGQPAYEGKSQEELRFEDYRKGVRGPSTGTGMYLSIHFWLPICLKFYR